MLISMKQRLGPPLTQIGEQTYLLVPTFADDVKGVLNPLDLFIQIFIHVHFKHSITEGPQRVSELLHGEHGRRPTQRPPPEFWRYWNPSSGLPLP